MTCRSCGTTIADNALICYRCGTATAEARVPAPPPRASRFPIVGLVLLGVIVALTIRLVACGSLL